MMAADTVNFMEISCETQGDEHSADNDMPPQDLQQNLDDPAGGAAEPFLTLKQAAAVLGKSLRALERSILGRWGNKLPDGWVARKIATDMGWQYVVVPPPGFTGKLAAGGNAARQTTAIDSPAAAGPEARVKSMYPQNIERPAIVIDRGQEVEYLLRELVAAQRQISEERRLRMEDLRLITQMQGSMRLLENKAGETSKLKEELECAQKEFRHLKDQYLELVNLPWWKRLFRRRR